MSLPFGLLVASLSGSGNPASITGTLTSGSTLTANLAASAGTASSWQWTLNGTNISGQTAQTYTVLSTDPGQSIGVVINGTYSASVSIPAIPPVFSAAPIITAATKTAVTYTAATLSNAGSPPATLLHDLYANGALLAAGYTSGAAYATQAAGVVMTVVPRAVQGGTTVVGTTSAGVAVTAAPAVIDTPDYATVGDSITNYGNSVVSISSATITRDTSGIVTVAKTGIGSSCVGRKNALLVNVAPASLNTIGDAAYVDANTITIATGVTGTPLLSTDVTINPGSGGLTMFDQMTMRGLFPHLQSKFNGGLLFKGNYGMQGDLSSQLTDVTAKAAAAVRPGHFVQLMDGVNSITPRGPVSVAQTIADRKALIDIVTAAGRTAVVCATKPVGTAQGSYATINANIQTLNSALQSYCDGITKIWADTFTPTYDGTSAASSWATIDGVHPVWRASKLDADAVYAAISSKITTGDLLPIAYNSTSVVPFATKLRIIGPYPAAPGYATSTTGFNTNGSGTRPSAGPSSWTCGSLGGIPTAVMSIVADPGDSKGTYVQVVHTATAANDKTMVRPDSNTGVTLATLGLNPGDRFIISMELSWSNYAASNCSAMQLQVTGSTAFNAGCGTLIGSQTESGTSMEADFGTKVFVSGVMTVPASGATSLTPALVCLFSAASVSGLTTLLRRISWDKVSGPV